MRSQNFLFTMIFVVLILFGQVTFAEMQESLTKQAIDGNTIMLDSGDIVRYIGVASPKIESLEPLSRDAYEFNKNLVEGKKIKLEFDEQRNDDQGYLLAYVYQDDIFVNAKIIENGYGKVFLVSPNLKYAETLLKLERDARQAKQGIWSESDINKKQSESSLQQNIASLEKRITILEAEIKELKDRIEQLTKIITTLQSSEKAKSIGESKNDMKQEISKQPDGKSSGGKTIVYISKNGTKYHKEGCRFLGNDPKAITLEEAKRRKLTPCKVCFPDQKEDK